LPSSLLGRDWGATEFLREGAATEFFLDWGTVEPLLVPTKEFALELA
jgi:hypothetical protein